MSHPLLLLRPAAQGFAVTLLMALAGCGLSSRDEAKAPEAAAVPELQSVPVQAQGAMLKRMAMPAPMAMHDAVAMEYRAEPREQYQNLPDNPVHSVAETPVSTFSVDVDTGSYANVRRFLNQGQLPPEGAVRLEEMVNYFPYDYPLPSDGSPFGVTTEVAATPWNPNTRLLRVGIKASERAVAELAPAVSRPWQRLHTAQADVVALWPAAQTARALWVGSSGQEPPAGDLLATATWLQSEVMSGVAPVMTATADAYVPQMLNYESVDGVNFKKGCYPGQEVVARSQFRGTLKQRAYVGQVFGQALNGDEIWVAGADGSHVGSVALAAPLIAGHTDVIASIKISALNQSLAIGSPEGPALTQLHLPYALAQDI